jgi:TonB-linked SusC/RagA family outer membrane protein
MLIFMKQTCLIRSGRLIGLLLFFVCSSFTVAIEAKEITVSGIVLDVEGTPLPGVNVTAGSTSKTVTNADGAYRLQAADDGKLTFSYLGFLSQEIEVKHQPTINVVMREATHELEDVVVVGYGTQKKVSVTASISNVEPATLMSVPAPSLSNTLGGQLPGIITRQTSGEPGFDGAQIYIRGISTWGVSSPLILVDGVERDINLVNAYEIESFSIMKDASATAVYGVRGANGVILINTKKGKNGKAHVTFRTEHGFLTGLRFPNYIDGYEFAGLMNEALRNSGKADAWTDDELEKFRTGSDPYLYPNVNWTDVVYKKHATQTMNNLSVSGGSETARYFVNAGYTSQGGLYREDENNEYDTNARIHRYNFRSNVDIDITKDLLLNLGLGSIIENRNYQGTPAQVIYDATKKISPINFPVQNPDGSAGGGPSYLQDNPWGLTTQSGYATQFRSTLQGTFGLQWDLSHLLTKGLSVAGKFAFDHFYFSEIFRRKAYEVKQYLGVDPVTHEDRYTLIREGAALGHTPARTANRSYYWETAANYERLFGMHRVGAMALFNRREYVDMEDGQSLYTLPYRQQGVAARVMYDYGSRYLIEFNMGYNGSENFPKGKRYGFFPSLSAGWVPSNEAFWNSTIVNHLKIRASHGQVGNDRVWDGNLNHYLRFLYITKINKNAPGYHFGSSQQFLGGMAEAQTGVDDISWEVSTKTNAGFDIGLFNSVLSIQADAFYERRNKILQKRTGGIPGYAGFVYESVPQGNVGTVENKGFDAMLELKNRTATGWFYAFRANFTFARSKIIENDQPEPPYPYLWEKGNPVGQPFGLIALGFFQSDEEIAGSPVQTFQERVQVGDIKFKDVNEDGVIDVYDRTPLGYPATPEIMFGFGGTAGYKGWDVTVHFSGVANRTNFLDLEGMYPFMLEYPNYNIYREYYDNRFVPGAADNSRAKYPAVIAGNNPNNYQTSTLYMRDAGYLKLQNAEIGYTLPAPLVKRLNISNLRLFVNGTNLLCFDKIKIVDPEFNITGAYPQQRVINLGAQIDF